MTDSPAATDAAIAIASRQIENLIARYAELVDGGDFEGLGVLLGGAAFSLNGGDPMTGAAEITEFANATLIVHDDGTPRTHHVTTNVLIEFEDSGTEATSRSYYTVIQQVGDHPLGTIAAGRYRDRFSIQDGEWKFTSREVNTDFAGDTSRHVHSPA